MDDATTTHLRVGGLVRGDLIAELRRSGVELNDYAVTLLENPAFDSEVIETVSIVHHTLEDLGMHDGAPLSQIFAAAKNRGLRLCPSVTAPYLRLQMIQQDSAPDSVMSNGRAPSASITVASAALSDDDEYPKGFYLRVVDGVRWLRGYVCDDSHVWSRDDRFAFQVWG